jgi:lysophospholipase L1-like esterase
MSLPKLLKPVLLIGTFVVTLALGAILERKRFLPTSLLRAVTEKLVGRDAVQICFPRATRSYRNTIFQVFHPHAEIVMIGDSLVQATEWSDMFPETSIANRGIGGDGTKEVLGRMATIYAVTPRRAFVMLGFNDFKTGHSVSETFANYRQIIEELRARDIEVYVQSTIECSRKFCGDKLDSIRALNLLLKSYSEEKKLTFIDLNKSLSSSTSGLLDRYTFDGVHLLGDGYAEWKREIERFTK